MPIGELTIFQPLRTIDSTLSRPKNRGFNHPDPEHTIKNSKIGYILMLALNAPPCSASLRLAPGMASIGTLDHDALHP